MWECKISNWKSGSPTISQIYTLYKDRSARHHYLSKKLYAVWISPTVLSYLFVIYSIPRCILYRMFDVKDIITCQSYFLKLTTQKKPTKHSFFIYYIISKISYYYLLFHIGIVWFNNNNNIFQFHGWQLFIKFIKND